MSEIEIETGLGDDNFRILSEKESTERNFVFEERKIRCCVCGDIIGYEQLTDEKETRFENQISTKKSRNAINNIICVKCRNQSS